MRTADASKKRSQDLQRILRVRARQKDVRWGPDYTPAVRAVRGEAPTISSSGTMVSALLQREIHSMSMPEKVLNGLALYNPAVWELHDQHVLYPHPTAHPLSFHPKWRVQSWPTTDGTFAIAEKLGLKKWHPAHWVPSGPANPHVQSLGDSLETLAPGHWETGAYIGDSLVYLKDAQGPYVLSWDIKSRAGEHGTPGGEATRKFSRQALDSAHARDAIYVEYMAQLGIRIVRASLDDIPKALAVSIFRLSRLHAHPVMLPDGLIADLLAQFKEALTTGEPPANVWRKSVHTPAEAMEAKTLLDIAIWQRLLRVDLYAPVLVDEPLVPERSDPLEDLAHLFAR